MYAPAHFALSESQAWDVVVEAGAGHLVVASASGLRTVFAPVLADPGAGTLRAHVGRANPWWRDAGEGDEVVGLFQLAQAYVSPSLYPGKAEDPAVVPTWDYVQVEARGTARIHDDPEFVEGVVRALTAQMESRRSAPWSVDDAPREYVEKLRRTIVGVEVVGVRVSGAAKLSQNKAERDRDSVHRSFAAGQPGERLVADQMERRW